VKTAPAAPKLIEQLQAKSLQQLRAQAQQTPGIGMTRTQISVARKPELIKLLAQAIEKTE